MRLKILLLLYISLAFLETVSGQPAKRDLLKALNRAIDSAEVYDAGKNKRIQTIRMSGAEAGSLTLPAQYDLYLALFNEYKVFNFDSAYLYAGKLQDLADRLARPERLAQAKTNRLFVLVSAGMYKEAADALEQIDISDQPDDRKADYYSLKARYYYDLADYVNDGFFTPQYNGVANALLDSALLYFPPASFESIYYQGLRHLKSDSLENAGAGFRLLLGRPGLTEHQKALVYSTLSYICLRGGDREEAITFQILAAMADIRSSTKETFAIYNLAQLLFEDGDFKNAAVYIEKAIGDASFYGARQRKVQISTLLPIIQGSRINFIESERRTWIIYGAIVSGILILLTLLVIIIYRQKKSLELAKKAISEAHGKLAKANDKLTETNSALQQANSELGELNNKLLEANKIKEEYVGYFFNINSVFFHKIERLKTAIGQKLEHRKWEEIRFIINKIDVKEEKEELMKSFDTAFLRLFPHFVEAFNSLLKEEEQIRLRENELLNTDLRIYALLRLGIRENEKIAEILEYSVKSIYAYKTKIRNKALVPKEEFDKKVMEIRSI